MANQSDFSGSVSSSDGLPINTNIVYRFASLRPSITSTPNAYQINFGNANVTIPLVGEPTLETYDIFECVITINGQTYHLGG